ncbi:hypothetical protein POMI540_4702 [Schizosaccharomyces pombe]|uniref:Uncharacterized protein PB24D3.07c n=1 Tax=Schizosaccharomyces pombe (strain 972 / ATCC 24843) TaxID=284812 RepID=YKM7_SCHPO|nr:uncharacterized protein SPAPB24D3.07c [Schizosaccharomyces pombe]Q9C0Y7.1 RecName: Full=Uncharacterized protein PB24D3.07c; Flags: Precursor [Schizosaccharomyces pombe 972h-]CAC36903.1 sequence orphan [Schizosaccharomyces pombe]|eukprot:NP_593993.1 uncharacterized protein SPAPB24D3.07c [Schizosaccharomyces pombe]
MKSFVWTLLGALSLGSLTTAYGANASNSSVPTPDNTLVVSYTNTSCYTSGPLSPDTRFNRTTRGTFSKVRDALKFRLNGPIHHWDIANELFDTALGVEIIDTQYGINNRTSRDWCTAVSALEKGDLIEFAAAFTAFDDVNPTKEVVPDALVGTLALWAKYSYEYDLTSIVSLFGKNWTVDELGWGTYIAHSLNEISSNTTGAANATLFIDTQTKSDCYKLASTIESWKYAPLSAFPNYGPFYIYGQCVATFTSGYSPLVEPAFTFASALNTTLNSFPNGTLPTQTQVVGDIGVKFLQYFA